MTYDIVIRGGTIVDGTGSEPVAGDVAIKDGKIGIINHVFRRTVMYGIC